MTRKVKKKKMEVEIYLEDLPGYYTCAKHGTNRKEIPLNYSPH